MKYTGWWGVFYKVTWIYLLSIGLLLFPLYSIDWIFSIKSIDYIWNTPTGLGSLHLVGIIGLSYAIWDGEFVNEVKPSHKSWQERNVEKE